MKNINLNHYTILAGQEKDNSLSKPVVSLLEKYCERKLSKLMSKPRELLEEIVREFLDSSDEKIWQ